jgi:hypothetical protein
MKFEIRGDTNSLRHLQNALYSRFKNLDFNTQWMDVLIIKVYSGTPTSNKLLEFLEAYCLGAGLTLNWETME